MAVTIFTSAYVEKNYGGQSKLYILGLNFFFIRSINIQGKMQSNFTKEQIKVQHLVLLMVSYVIFRNILRKR